jgi:hypothetical protein
MRRELLLTMALTATFVTSRDLSLSRGSRSSTAGDLEKNLPDVTSPRANCDFQTVNPTLQALSRFTQARLPSFTHCAA